MKILVTGSKGFVGKNLITELRNRGFCDIFEYDIDSDKNALKEYTKTCDFVFHLAGVNRPKDEKMFMQGNFGFTSELLDLLKQNGSKVPVLITSSIQAERDNPYGQSKKAGEDLVFAYGKENGVKVFVYRLPNLFGKWSRPNYNTVVATFCNNIARGLPIKIDDPDALLTLCYIDDVMDAFVSAMQGEASCTDGRFYTVQPSYTIKLGELAGMLRAFKDMPNTRLIPNLNDGLTKKLHSTFISFLPEDGFSYDLTMHSDHRGSFTELFRTHGSGQVSVNVSKPGITKGGHWHHTKVEKFVVVSGEALMRFRKIGSSEVIEYRADGGSMQVVDIPPGYTHDIINVGDDDLVTIMWANECFNPDAPDTITELV